MLQLMLQFQRYSLNIKVLMLQLKLQFQCYS